MTGKNFAAACLNVANNYKTVYMWGVFGAPVTESVIASKTLQYPDWYTKARQASLRALTGRNYFAFDCIGLIKGILWGWNGDGAAAYGGARYAANGVPDTSADAAIKACTGVSTDFSGLEVGEALWLSGHIGVYIGGGLAVECSPKWSGGVQITAVGNLGCKAGYNARTWTKHGKMPWIDYTVTEMEEEEELTLEAFRELMTQYRNELRDNDSGTWSSDARRWVVDNGLFVGGDTTATGEPNYMWEDLLTREQAAQLLYRFALLMGKV